MPPPVDLGGGFFYAETIKILFNRESSMAKLIPPKAEIPKLYAKEFGAATKADALAKKYPGLWFGRVPAEGGGWLVALLDGPQGNTVMFPE